MILDLLLAPYKRQLKKLGKEATWMQMQFNILWLKTQSLLIFYLLPKIKKRLHDVSGRPVI